MSVVASSVSPAEAASLLGNGESVVCPACGAAIVPLPDGWRPGSPLRAISCSQDSAHYFVLFEDRTAMTEIRDLIGTFAKK